MTATKTIKRKCISWKSEAKRLERLLAEACEALVSMSHGLPNAHPDIAQWWETYQERMKGEQIKLRSTGLAKLSAAEREALGVKS